MKLKYLCICVLLIAIPASLYSQAVRRGVRWDDLPYSGGYIVEIQDSLGRVVLQSDVVRPPYLFDINPGLYNLRITTLNRWGEVENRSDWVPFDVRLEKIENIDNTVAEKKDDDPLYLEVYIYDLPTTSFYPLTTPQYWAPLKFRLGYKNLLTKGFNIGLQSELFSLAYKMDLPYGFGSYNIPASGIHALDLSFHANLAGNLYFVPHIYPVAAFLRTVALLKNENGVDYVSPQGYLNDADFIQFISARFITEKVDILYIRTINLLFGGSISLQYYSANSPITATASFNIWGSYGLLSGGNFDLIVYYGFEAAIGIRL